MHEFPCGIANVIYIYRFGTCHDMQMPYVFRIVGVRFIEPAFTYYTQALVDLRAPYMGPLQRYMRALSCVMDESPCGIADVIYIYRFGTCHAMQMLYVFRIVGVRFIEPAFPYYTWASVDFGRHKWGPYKTVHAGIIPCHG